MQTFNLKTLEKIKQMVYEQYPFVMITVYDIYLDETPIAIKWYYKGQEYGITKVIVCVNCIDMRQEDFAMKIADMLCQSITFAIRKVIE